MCNVLVLLHLTAILLSCSRENNSDLTLPYDSITDTTSEYFLVIGDLQEYTNQNIRMFEETVSWINSQMEYGVKFNFILQVGDVTASNSPYQWQNYTKAILPISDKIPIILCTGNHDYDWNDKSLILDRNSTLYNDYIIYDENEDIVAIYEYGKKENVISKLPIGNDYFYIISLEFGPRDEVLAWANDFVASHIEERFILLTHEFLDGGGNRISSGSFAVSQIRNTTANTPEMVWNKLVFVNPNIISVICGHNGFYAYSSSENVDGRLIPQVMFNLQYQPNGGDGWIQIWKVDSNLHSVVSLTYNCLKKEVLSYGTFSFQYK